MYQIEKLFILYRRRKAQCNNTPSIILQLALRPVTILHQVIIIMLAEGVKQIKQTVNSNHFSFIYTAPNHNDSFLKALYIAR